MILLQGDGCALSATMDAIARAWAKEEGNIQAELINQMDIALQDRFGVPFVDRQLTSIAENLDDTGKDFILRLANTIRNTDIDAEAQSESAV